MSYSLPLVGLYTAPVRQELFEQAAALKGRRFQAHVLALPKLAISTKKSVYRTGGARNSLPLVLRAIAFELSRQGNVSGCCKDSIEASFVTTKGKQALRLVHRLQTLGFPVQITSIAA